MKKLFSMLCILCFLVASVGAEEAPSEKNITDILKDPVKALLAPIKAGGLVDIVFKPAEAVLRPILDLGAIVVTPGRTAEYLYNINKSISIIESEDMMNSEPKFIQQALVKETNIVSNGFMNNAKDNKIDIRGYGDAGPMNYLVLIDGRRTNQIDLSGADLAQIDVNSIDRVEIVRGPGTVLYGDNATGGVINIITKKGDSDCHIDYTQEFGSYQYSKEYLSARGGQDFMNYFFSYSYQTSDGIPVKQ